MAYETEFDVAAGIAHVEPLRGLAQKANPRHAALIVIDMQNDFIAPEGLIAREGLDRFFGEIATIADLTALWPARNAPPQNGRLA